jgi:tetratricopeptide (TPR) repeat protein
MMEGQVAQLEGRFEDALVLAQQSLERLQTLGLPVDFVPPRYARATCLRGLGRYDETLEIFEEVAELHRQHGQLGFLSTTLIDTAETLRLAGRLDEADRLAVEGEELGGPEDLVNFAYGRATRAHIASAQGRHEDALELARSALDYGYRIDFPRYRGGAHVALAAALRAPGDIDAARVEYERALAIYEPLGWTHAAAETRKLMVEL